MSSTNGLWHSLINTNYDELYRACLEYWQVTVNFLFYRTISDNDKILRLSKRKIVLFTSLGLSLLTYWYYKKSEKDPTRHDHRTRSSISSKNNDPNKTSSNRYKRSNQPVPHYQAKFNLNQNRPDIYRDRDIRLRYNSGRSASNGVAMNGRQKVNSERVSDDDVSTISNLTSISQKYYPALADVVRFRVPNSNDIYTPQGERLSNASVSSTNGSASVTNSTLVSTAQVASELNQLDFSQRQEVYECLNGMEKLLTCAQVAFDKDLDGGNQSNGQGQETKADKPTRVRLESMRQQIEIVKDDINAYEIESMNKENSSVQNESEASSVSSKLPLTKYETEVLPAFKSSRKAAVSVCESAVSLVSNQTDAWFSCESGQTTPTLSDVEGQQGESSSVAQEPEGYIHVNLDVTSVEVEKIHSRTLIYDNLLPNAHSIKYRKDRHQATNCQNLEEYLVKTEITRKCFNLLYSNYGPASEKFVKYLVGSGRFILSGLMRIYGKDTFPAYKCEEAFDDFLRFARTTSADDQLAEVAHKRVRYFNFYDIILDYILLDAFDDLKNPPQKVTNILNNRFLTRSFKESSVTNAVWIVIRSKRGSCKNKGFLFHYYNLWETVSPVLAWAFMCPFDESQKHLKLVCNEIRSQMLEFIEKLYSFAHVDYSSFENASRSIASLVLKCFQACSESIEKHGQSQGLRLPEELGELQRALEACEW